MCHCEVAGPSEGQGYIKSFKTRPEIDYIKTGSWCRDVLRVLRLCLMWSKAKCSVETSPYTSSPDSLTPVWRCVLHSLVSGQSRSPAVLEFSHEDMSVCLSSSRCGNAARCQSLLVVRRGLQEPIGSHTDCPRWLSASWPLSERLCTCRRTVWI